MTDEQKPSGETMPYVHPPQVCGECINRCIADAMQNTTQDFVSVFCPHGSSLLTAQLAEHEGERVIYAWSLSGPMTEAQAVEWLGRAAKQAGAVSVANTGGAKLH